MQTWGKSLPPKRCLSYSFCSMSDVVEYLNFLAIQLLRTVAGRKTKENYFILNYQFYL